MTENNTNAKLDKWTQMEEFERNDSHAVALAIRATEKAPEPYKMLVFEKVLAKHLGTLLPHGLPTIRPTIVRVDETQPIVPHAESVKSRKPSKKAVSVEHSARILPIVQAVDADPSIVSKWAALLEPLAAVPRLYGLLRMARDEFHVEWLSGADLYAVAVKFRVGMPVKTVRARLSDAPASEVMRKPDTDGTTLFQLAMGGERALSDAIAKAERQGASEESEA